MTGIASSLGVVHRISPVVKGGSSQQILMVNEAL